DAGFSKKLVLKKAGNGFYIMNIEGEIEYNVSFSPQRREDDETNLRIVVELSLSDSNNKEQFFFSEHTGYFLVSENFKEFIIYYFNKNF
ncbi:MAG TPA: hypothetical protein PK061_07010, partial [Enterococcus aquimarinus]|nr:hypothetical protein [Enterococcus aquimarinus]